MHLLRSLHQKQENDEHKNGVITTVISRTDTNQSSIKTEGKHQPQRHHTHILVPVELARGGSRYNPGDMCFGSCCRN